MLTVKPPTLAFFLGTWVLSAPACSHESGHRPDIAVLFTDQQRAGSLSLDGASHPRTPAMARLAAKGVRFTSAFCATPQCSPTRAAILTGRYPHRTGVVGNVGDKKPPAGMSGPLDPGVPGLGKIFAAGGYETAYFGKWHLGNDPGLHGFEVHNGGKADDAETTRRTVEFIKDRKQKGQKRRPFFLMASWVNPHDIYEFKASTPIDPERLEEVLLPRSTGDDLSAKPFPQRHFLEADQGSPFRRFAADVWRRYLSFYESLVEKVDAEIAQVVDALEKDGEPGTVIVFTSDHGDLGGAHGLPFKGPAMYEELVKIPLIISWRGKLAGSVRDDLVSHIDLLPTLCDLASIETPPGIDGKSLRPLLEQKDVGAGEVVTPETVPPWRDAVFAEYHGKQNWRVPIRMVRTKKWKLTRYVRYGEELYDLEKDPDELRNLAGKPENEAIQKELSSRLDRWIAETGDPFPALGVTDRSGREVP